MTLIRRSLVALFTLLAASISAQAQISYTGGTYTQNFDALPSSGTYTFTGIGPFALDASPFSPVAQLPLAGWSFAKYSPATGNAIFLVSTGSANSGGAYSLGTTTERALGLLGSGSNASRIGVKFVNNTGASITSFTVTFTGEQWRRGSAAANKLTFSYAVGDASINLNTGTFSTESGLDFTAPLTSGPNAAVDGNLAANRVAGITKVVAGFNWAPGTFLVLRWTDVDDTGSDDTLGIDDFSFTQGGAPDPSTATELPIHTVQGNGAASTYVGQTVAIQGIVTGVYPSTTPSLGGFYLQAAEADYDNDPATSEGMFVNTTTFTANVGDVVKAVGTVEERTSSGVTSTRLTSVSSVTPISTGATLPTAVPISLPFASLTAAEPYEGMRVTLPQTLTLTDNFDLGHFGEVILSLGRLSTPTNVVAPGAPAIALEGANLLSQILVDDSLDTQYPEPTPGLADSAGRGLTRRAGSTVAGVTGVLDNKFGVYLVEATTWPTFIDANPRGNPPAVSGSLKIAIGNVLNFFNGNGSGLDGAAGGFPTSRGATNLAEYQRQRAKIIAGITAVAPDIMGLTEVENDRVTNGLADSYGPTSAIADIVNGLNAAAPSGTTYAYVNAAAVDTVTDVIHCAFIYRAETVAPVGSPAMLNDAAFNNVARNPQAQTFRQISNGEKLTVAINHFRAKGGAAAGAGNTDSGDGQGTNNALRVQEANALTAWLATDPTGSGDPDFLIIGDLNAYAKENPIAAIESAGYVNLTEAAEGVGGYSYSFNGEFGHLDHALANDHLAGQVVDAGTWHVNSDEPIYYDYNTENKSAAQQAINVGTPYRYSDHDPVVVGLNLHPDPAADVTGQLTITRTGLLRNRTTGRYNQTITIKNTSAVPYAGPVSLVFDALSANATLFGAAGFTTIAAPLGSPYANVNVGPDSTLTPGESVTVLVEFTNPSNQAITYTNRVLAGPGGR